MRRYPQPVYNITLALWLLASAVYTARYIYLDVRNIPIIMVVISLFLLSYFSSKRANPYSRSVQANEYLIPLLATLWPVAYLFLSTNNGHSVGALFEYAGGGLMLLSALSLRNSFALFPEARNIVSTGVYKFVRHPLYLSYLFIDFSIALSATSMFAWCIYLVEVALFILRIIVEEKHLIEHSSEFRQYALNTKYRLFPLLF